MYVFRLTGCKFLSAFFGVAALIPAGMAGENPPAFSLPAVRGRNLVRIALIDDNASPRHRAAAQLEALGLQQGDAFVRAVTAADQPLIQLYLTAGATGNTVGAQGRTPLLAAVLARDWTLTEKLLKAGANPRVADEKGLTPLMAAALAGHLPHD